jgi:hypothetical protein
MLLLQKLLRPTLHLQKLRKLKRRSNLFSLHKKAVLSRTAFLLMQRHNPLPTHPASV